METQTKKIGLLSLLILLLGLSGFGQVTITPTITPSCTAFTGAVTFSISGGTSGYTFFVDGVSLGYSAQQTSPTFTGLYTGTYRVYAYNNQDSASAQFVIPTLVSGSPTVTDATCTQSNGAASITASGGTGPYTYQWFNNSLNSVIGSTSSISSVAAGTYYCNITDHNGCVSDTAAVTIASSSPVTASISNNGNTCHPALTASGTGGASPYHFAWSTGATTAAITITTDGTYYVTVTDANGCSASQSANVAIGQLRIDTTTISVINPSCNMNNGSIIVYHVIGAVSPISWQWSSGVSTDSIDLGLAPGQYTLTVTDANGCTGTDYFNLPNNSISVSAGNNSATCGNSDGVLVVNAFYGSGSYTYLWSDGATTSQVSNVPAGSYTVTVSDGTGCSVTASTTVLAIGTYQVTITTTPTACDTALHTGTATANIIGTGNAPYSFDWSISQYYIGNNTVSGGTTQTIYGLTYGDYMTVAVADASGCVPSNYQRQDSSFISFDPACFDQITGYVYLDSNNNCIHNPGEPGFGGAYVYAYSTTGQSYYATPDSTGFYDISVLPGIYTVQSQVYTLGNACSIGTCVNSYQDTFTTTGQVLSGDDFGIGGTGAFDLGVHMGYQGSAPGQQREYWIYYYNWGPVSVPNGILTFVHDPNITLVSTIPAYTSYNAATQTITWDIVNNLSFQQWLNQQHEVVMYFDIPSSLPLGTLLTAYAAISPTAGDCDTSDNAEYLTDPVTASHDPNSKEVSPAGNLSASDSVLTYTIRFENDGNAPANSIVIKDTLSPNVNPATVQPGASSAPYTYKMSGNGVLTFTFQGINLPDTSHGDSSRGFVMYTVHTRPNLPLGTQVNNTASIYFDLNPAVVTNTTVSTRSDWPTGIANIANSTMTAQVIPNPANEKAMIQFTGATGTISLQITDALGNLIATSHLDSKAYTLDAEKLSTGIYFYTAKDVNGNKATGKISVVH
jgi:uncharacterized repeat protein (TIGR01451 family)